MEQIDRAAFGAFVSQLRREKGLTQRQLAETLHISDKAVSKWETGVSIPDVGLLLPLAEVLGVSVTELLLCRRDAAPDLETAEAAVRTALAYGEELPRAWREKGRWRLLFLLSALIGGLCALLLARMGRLTESTVLALGFGGGFGAYFTFWAPLRLPRYYDENSLSAWSDGPFRMNLPGVRFTNGNWPHILRRIRLWSCGCLAVAPALSLALGTFPSWASLERWVFLALLLGGLFLPVVLAGRKYA